MLFLFCLFLARLLAFSLSLFLFSVFCRISLLSFLCRQPRFLCPPLKCSFSFRSKLILSNAYKRTRKNAIYGRFCFSPPFPLLSLHISIFFRMLPIWFVCSSCRISMDIYIYIIYISYRYPSGAVLLLTFRSAFCCTSRIMYRHTESGRASSLFSCFAIFLFHLFICLITLRCVYIQWNVRKRRNKVASSGICFLPANLLRNREDFFHPTKDLYLACKLCPRGFLRATLSECKKTEDEEPSKNKGEFYERFPKIVFLTVFFWLAKKMAFSYWQFSKNRNILTPFFLHFSFLW